MPIPEKANSVMLLRPMTTAPAARSRVTATAPGVAGAASRRIFEPAVVTSPAISKRSLIETGRPANADGTTPSFRSRSEASAASSAPRAGHFGETAPAFAARVGDPRERRLDQSAARGLALGELLREHRDRADDSFSHSSRP